MELPKKDIPIASDKMLIQIAAIAICRYKKNMGFKEKVNVKTLPWIGRPKTDLSGRRYAQIQIIGYVGRIEEKESWLASCECGEYFNLTTTEFAQKRIDKCPLCIYIKDLIPKLVQELFSLEKKKRFMELAKESMPLSDFCKLLIILTDLNHYKYST